MVLALTMSTEEAWEAIPYPPVAGQWMGCCGKSVPHGWPSLRDTWPNRLDFGDDWYRKYYCYHDSAVVAVVLVLPLYIPPGAPSTGDNSPCIVGRGLNFEASIAFPVVVVVVVVVVAADVDR